MGAAFLFEAGNFHFPASLLVLPLFLGAGATTLSATRYGGLGYRSKRAPWIVAGLALLAVVILTAIFLFVMTAARPTSGR